MAIVEALASVVLVSLVSLIGAAATDHRSIAKTLDIGWDLLSAIPMDQLTRIKPETRNKYYQKKK